MGQEIECPLCQKAESDFSRINEGINRAATLTEKASHARELLQKVETLLKEHENVESSLAEACRTVLNLRKNAAEMVLKLEKMKK
jgi:phage shock protein A